MVLPRPISSARIHPSRRQCLYINHWNPSSWKGMSFPPLTQSGCSLGGSSWESSSARASLSRHSRELNAGMTILRAAKNRFRACLNAGYRGSSAGGGVSKQAGGLVVGYFETHIDHTADPATLRGTTSLAERCRRHHPSSMCDRPCSPSEKSRPCLARQVLCRPEVQARHLPLPRRPTRQRGS